MADLSDQSINDFIIYLFPFNSSYIHVLPSFLRSLHFHRYSYLQNSILCNHPYSFIANYLHFGSYYPLNQLHILTYDFYFIIISISLPFQPIF